MAYADANTSQRKLTAGVAVAAREFGLAWAIVAGLAMNASLHKDKHVTAIPIVQPIATPPPPPKPQTKVEPAKPQAPIPLALRFSEFLRGEKAKAVLARYDYLPL